MGNCRSSPVSTFFSVTALDLVLAVYFRDDAVPDILDLRVCVRPALQGRTGPQLIAAVYDCHFAGELGQEQRFLQRAIAATHHYQLLVAEEETVTGSAVAHATPDQPVFTRYPQLAR